MAATAEPVIEVEDLVTRYGNRTILDGVGLTVKRGQSVLVDMSDVSYIDSSGIATLVEGLQHAKGRKLGFGLVGIGEGVMQVIKLTRLDQVFPIYESVALGKSGGG